MAQRKRVPMFFSQRTRPDVHTLTAIMLLVFSSACGECDEGGAGGESTANGEQTAMVDGNPAASGESAPSIGNEANMPSSESANTPGQPADNGSAGGGDAQGDTEMTSGST